MKKSLLVLLSLLCMLRVVAQNTTSIKEKSLSRNDLYTFDETIFSKNPQSTMKTGCVVWAVGSCVAAVGGAIYLTRMDDIDNLATTSMVSSSMIIAGGVIGVAGLMTVLIAACRKTEGIKINNSTYLKDSGTGLNLTCKF